VPEEALLHRLSSGEGRFSTTTTSEDQPSGRNQLSGEVRSDPVIWSREELSKGQLDDPDIGYIVRLRQSEDKPSWDQVSLQSADAKQLWQEWERLILDNGILYRRWISIDGAADRQQVVLPRSFRSEFVRLVHTGMTGGHLVRRKTEEQVQRRAYWPRWRSDVAMELKKCPECAQYHRGQPPKQTFLQPFNADEPFEAIAVHITGRHPKSARGNEYIVTATCLFSRWAEAFPVRNHTAPTVAKVRVEQLFTRFGVPKRILTDLGAEFQGQLFEEMCKRFEIDQVRTTAYEPRTNGQVERFHRTLNSMLGKSVQQNHRDWDDRLPYVMAAYRASRHGSTKFTPNMMVFGRENRAPADLVFNSVQGESERYDSPDDYVFELQTKLREAHHLARGHLRVAAERRKETYDIKVKRTTFNVGQWVWYLIPRKFVGRYPKWTRDYVGPYLITRVILPSDYMIQRNRRAAPIVVHGDKLKLCYGDHPASWIGQTGETGQVRPEDRPAGAAESTSAEADQGDDVSSREGAAGVSPTVSLLWCSQEIVGEVYVNVWSKSSSSRKECHNGQSAREDFRVISRTSNSDQRIEFECRRSFSNIVRAKGSSPLLLEASWCGYWRPTTEVGVFGWSAIRVVERQVILVFYRHVSCAAAGRVEYGEVIFRV